MRPSSPDLAACRELIRHGSKSFFLASLLLPPPVREPAYALYAFCRVADDVVDSNPPPQSTQPETKRQDRVRSLHERLDAIYGGSPRSHPVDRALTAVVQRYDLPRPVFDALLEGFQWDLDGRSYETFDDLLGYCARVASTVGVLMSLLMGQRQPATLARACDLGAAMQLTNIARDVGTDARAGRLYLPRVWLREAGIDPVVWLTKPTLSPALAEVVHRLLDEARFLYRRADDGVARLPLACRWSIATAGRVYAAIGDQVARAEYDAMTRRAVVPLRQKLVLVAAAGGRLLRPAGEYEYAPPLAATRFLIEAVTTWTPNADRARSAQILS